MATSKSWENQLRERDEECLSVIRTLSPRRWPAGYVRPARSRRKPRPLRYSAAFEERKRRTEALLVLSAEVRWLEDAALSAPSRRGQCDAGPVGRVLTSVLISVEAKLPQRSSSLHRGCWRQRLCGTTGLSGESLRGCSSSPVSCCQCCRI